MISQGDVCWASLDDPSGSEAGFRRPVLIVQGDLFNASRIATVAVVPLASNQRLAAAPGNVALPTAITGLTKDSVANVSQIITVDRGILTERVGRISAAQIDRVLVGIDLVLGRN